MKLTMLGTGNALVTKCYNTCFVIDDDNKYFMIDGGGGNTVLTNLEKVGLNWMDIRHIFVTHKHLDHIAGIFWMVRMICQHMRKGEYEGDANIYGHEEVINLIRNITSSLISKKDASFIDDRLHLVVVRDGETRIINGRKVTFFDTQSTKAKQFGFTMEMDGERKLACCGDEPYRPCEEKYVKGSAWLLHEAYCLDGEADIFHPHEKHHSTAKDVACMAQQLGIENLVLYHTEEKNLEHRRELYTAEGQSEFSGNIFVPEDLETIAL